MNYELWTMNDERIRTMNDEWWMMNEIEIKGKNRIYKIKDSPVINNPEHLENPKIQIVNYEQFNIAGFGAEFSHLV